MLTSREDDPETVAERDGYALAIWRARSAALTAEIVPPALRQRMAGQAGLEPSPCTVLVLSRDGRPLRRFLCAADSFPAHKFLREVAADLLQHLIALDAGGRLPPDESERIVRA